MWAMPKYRARAYCFEYGKKRKRDDRGARERVFSFEEFLSSFRSRFESVHYQAGLMVKREERIKNNGAIVRVFDRWAGASNPQPHPNPTHNHSCHRLTQPLTHNNNCSIINARFLCFQLERDGPTEQRTDGELRVRN